MHFFGIVQYIGLDRSDDWLTFYQELMGAQPVPAHERFGILPQGTLIRFPSTDTSASFMMQLIEPEGEMFDGAEYVQRIGLVCMMYAQLLSSLVSSMWSLLKPPVRTQTHVAPLQKRMNMVWCLSLFTASLASSHDNLSL